MEKEKINSILKFIGIEKYSDELLLTLQKFIIEEQIKRYNKKKE